MSEVYDPPATSVVCPKCGADIDQPCKIKLHESLSIHRQRFIIAREKVQQEKILWQ